MVSLENTTAVTESEKSLTKIMGREIFPQSLKEKFLLATFQIVAEQGADALSANELIKKTNSSKGALFHHFKTLDELCLESLIYLKTQSRLTPLRTDYASLNEYLTAFAQDCHERQANKAFFHITHFFRDRALKDERFKKALNDLYAGFLVAHVDQAMKYLSSQTDRNQVREVIIFTYMCIERMCYRKITSTEPDRTEQLVPWFISCVENRLIDLQPKV